MAQQGVSLAPSTFIEGGLFSDLDMTIGDAKFAEWDYNGTISPPVLAMGVQFIDENGKTYDQYFSAGDLKRFVPSEDGNMAIPVGDAQAMNNNTNAAKFLMSLCECGFPEELIGPGDLSALVGTKVHVVRVAQPKREGLIRDKQSDRPDTVLLVTKLIALPGQAATAKKGLGAKKPAATATVGKPALGAKAPAATAAAAGKANGLAKTGAGLGAGKVAAPAKKTLGGKAAPAAAAAPEAPAETEGADEETLSLAKQVLIQCLIDGDGTVDKKNLPAAAVKQLAGNKLKTKVVPVIHSDEFLNAVAAEPLEVDGTTYTAEYDGATFTVTPA